MTIGGHVPAIVVLSIAALFAISTPPAAVSASEASPPPVAKPSAAPATGASASAALPLIGHVHASTPFCQVVVDDASALADNQLADILTTTEALRILVYAPFDRDRPTEHRAARALETLSDRLMASRRGTAQQYVAGLRAAAKGGAGEAPRPELARFAGALDGAHSESSRVAKEISQALSILASDDLQYGMYMPDYQVLSDPRFARANSPVPFPVDATLERFTPDSVVENGPLHAYARTVAYEVASSLERLLISVDDARKLFPTAMAGCLDDDASPAPAGSATP